MHVLVSVSRVLGCGVLVCVCACMRVCVGRVECCGTDWVRLAHRVACGMSPGWEALSPLLVRGRPRMAEPTFPSPALH